VRHRDAPSNAKMSSGNNASFIEISLGLRS
jgi:hypothetical protein